MSTSRVIFTLFFNIQATAKHLYLKAEICYGKVRSKSRTQSNGKPYPGNAPRGDSPLLFSDLGKPNNTAAATAWLKPFFRDIFTIARPPSLDCSEGNKVLSVHTKCCSRMGRSMPALTIPSCASAHCKAGLTHCIP